EAFDKGAQMLGLGFPGGPALDRLAQKGDPRVLPFPASSIKKHKLEFSFSGLKTALLYRLQAMDSSKVEAQKAALAAAYQEAMVTAVIDKAFTAVRQRGVQALAVVGGVSANSRLRALLHQRATDEHITLGIPPLCYCTDNAAMIAVAGRASLRVGKTLSFD